MQEKEKGSGLCQALLVLGEWLKAKREISLEAGIVVDGTLTAVVGL
ncbi:MAG: hypothetical protein ABIO92_05635 [Chloroflexia bacterium]